MGIKRIRPFKIKPSTITSVDEEKKTCTKCNISKPFDDFYKRKASPDGRQTICKECMKLYRKKNKYLT